MCLSETEGSMLQLTIKLSCTIYQFYNCGQVHKIYITHYLFFPGIEI